MADYWKSQPRKFCEFCKCWIADNKPSVEFHERGKRHKENVEKKITEVRKRSGEKAKEMEEMQAGLAHVEKAALEALKKDIAKDPSLAAQYGVKLKSSANGSEEKKHEKAAKPGDSGPEAATAEKVREWYEAKSPEGYSYYWNTTTNASVWEPPEDFVSLAEQEGLVDETSQSEQQTSDSVETKAAEKQEEQKESADEPPRKMFRVDPVGTRGAAYGAWETVRQEPGEPDSEPEPEPEPVPPGEPPAVMDIPLPGEIPLPEETPLPLPADIPLPDADPTPAPDPPPQPVKKDRFKEKTVTSLGPASGGNVGFKKRKIASGARNARQRDNDD